MRTTHRCPKCQHAEIVVLRHVAGEQVYLPSERDPPEAPVWRRAAAREAYICRACGFTEYYTRDVDRIPVDGDLVALLTPTGPYR